MKKSISPDSACRTLIDNCNDSFSKLISLYGSIPEDAKPLFIGYLDSISILINRSKAFIDTISENPNFK